MEEIIDVISRSEGPRVKCLEKDGDERSLWDITHC